ncbi:MAG: phosphonate ABC transporter, permease protein PhnE [Stappia sp.]|uniref:phosphonate ABC transporter, permease protein PhnE n=1 Tax=Stappia sp. TaxID=1870903 RepID=UPI000C6703BD|nr:phosphonate ABC transporter, permease protein PhnE [Stappia sp.]MAA98965.1 phosphonate ABC transporter, permease protein PhnE [Stappia sp.]MBM19002.1 phosphonate ABC transporter, permease protein PhnE [Stappia sp.]|tara:strand:- start:56 stop:883 length:828 start_codon:yes stop_codon:yes gene_type:complete
MHAHPAPSAAAPSPAVLAALRPQWSSLLGTALVLGVIALLLGLSWYPTEMNNWTRLFQGNDFLSSMVAQFLAPDFSNLPLYIRKMIETVQIALWGTVLAIIFGAPLALLASSNIAPAWVVFPMRRLMDASRAINDLVFAVLFVAVVGLGPLPGVLAIFVHNLGIVSKLFSEAVEAIDHRPVEGIRTTGATRLQEIVYGVIPQVIPLWSSFSLYRFETNVRSATVLGIVGAGGIGFTFNEAFKGFRFEEASAIIIVMVVTVSVIDMISSRLRKLLV